MDRSIAEGTYARKQLKSRSRLIAWSHATRFRIGLDLVRDVRPDSVLDYGCGDGTFLALLHEGATPPSRAIGAEVSAELIESNRQRFGALPGLDFIHVDELARTVPPESFDCVVCMEVLEHVLDPVAMLDTFHRLLRPGGCLLISVPVEIGFSVVIKQAVREINGWRGIGDYPGTTRYTWGELARAVFAGPVQHVVRPIHHPDHGTPFHDHKGFNWRLLRENIRSRFELEVTRSSPTPWIPPFFASQVWFRARKAEGPTRARVTATGT